MSLNLGVVLHPSPVCRERKPITTTNISWLQKNSCYWYIDKLLLLSLFPSLFQMPDREQPLCCARQGSAGDETPLAAFSAWMENSLGSLPGTAGSPLSQPSLSRWHLQVLVAFWELGGVTPTSEPGPAASSLQFGKRHGTTRHKVKLGHSCPISAHLQRFQLFSWACVLMGEVQVHQTEEEKEQKH